MDAVRRTNTRIPAYSFHIVCIASTVFHSGTIQHPRCSAADDADFMRIIFHKISPTLTPPSGPQWMLLVLQMLLALAMLQSAGPVPTSSAPPSVPSVFAVAGAHEQWIPPIPNTSATSILRPFVPPESPWSRAHRGIDLRADSTDVLSPAAGEVVYVGKVVDRHVITVEHANGLLSSFEPVLSELEVGDAVQAGQIIGTIDPQHAHCDVACVHWGVRQPDAWKVGSTVRDLYVDPAFLLGWSEPSILWPIDRQP